MGGRHGLTARQREARQAIHREVAERVRMLREAEGVTQRQLAEAIGVTRQHVCNIERGHSGISLDTLADIADAFGQELRSLIPKG